MPARHWKQLLGTYCEVREPPPVPVADVPSTKPAPHTHLVRSALKTTPVPWLAQLSAVSVGVADAVPVGVPEPLGVAAGEYVGAMVAEAATEGEGAEDLEADTDLDAVVVPVLDGVAVVEVVPVTDPLVEGVGAADLLEEVERVARGEPVGTADVVAVAVEDAVDVAVADLEAAVIVAVAVAVAVPEGMPTHRPAALHTAKAGSHAQVVWPICVLEAVSPWEDASGHTEQVGAKTVPAPVSQ